MDKNCAACCGYAVTRLGDDVRDMQAANASGMRGIIANYGYVNDDASAKNWNAHGSMNKPTELLDLIDF